MIRRYKASARVTGSSCNDSVRNHFDAEGRERAGCNAVAYAGRTYFVCECHISRATLREAMAKRGMTEDEVCAAFL